MGNLGDNTCGIGWLTANKAIQLLESPGANALKHILLLLQYQPLLG